jgi:hypothetical protein
METTELTTNDLLFIEQLLADSCDDLEGLIEVGIVDKDVEIATKQELAKRREILSRVSQLIK